MKFEETIIGKGKPYLIITSGIHGNEYSSDVLVNELLKIKPQKGRIKFINKINQEAYKSNKRFMESDLNRSFPGKEDGTYEERLAKKTLEKVKNADYVLDIHSFKMDSEVMTVNFGGENFNLTKALTTKYSWIVHLDNTFEQRYQNTFSFALTQRGIDNVCIELPALENLREDHITESVEGYKNFLRYIGMLGGNAHDNNPKPLKRELGYSPSNGIFMPKSSIMEEVKKGDLIGKLITSDFKTVPVTAFKDGILTQVYPRSKVHKDMPIYGISILI